MVYGQCLVGFAGALVCRTCTAAWNGRGPVLPLVFADEAAKSAPESAMTMPQDVQSDRDAQYLLMLQRLLSIRPIELRPALDEAATMIAGAFGADKVDVFIYQPERDSLVALGTSKTPLGDRQRALGLDHLSLANGGRGAWTFTTGEAHLTGRADLDPEELRGVTEGLGIRSIVNVPIMVGDERRGVLQVDSTKPDFFTEDDLSALTAVAGWAGLVMHRAELIERAVDAAERRGERRAAEDIARITPRQREVAVLVAAGLSNAEIARRLVLSEGTVANHIEAILRRLNLNSRTGVAVWAVERGLYSSTTADDEPDEGASKNDRRRWPGRSVGQNHQDGPSTLREP
jgi:DNA-binding CsgD family transcriptional regulator